MRFGKRSAPLALLLLSLVLALGALGVSYANWNKTLFIDGTVHTGNVDAQWTFVGCYDIESKDVGTTTGRIVGADPQILHFTINNGYPSYTGGCEVEYRVTGSVPVRVESIGFAPGPGLTGCDVTQQQNTGTFTAACDQLTVRWVDGLCVQLHTGDEHAGSIRVHVEQQAAMSSDYTFDLSVLFVQYNESSCP
jgi:hypothetical protein